MGWAVHFLRIKVIELLSSSSSRGTEFPWRPHLTGSFEIVLIVIKFCSIYETKLKILQVIRQLVWVHTSVGIILAN